VRSRNHCCRGQALTTTDPTPRQYPYSDVVVGLARSSGPASYAGGSLATGRVFHAGQVKGDDPDGKGHPGPAGWETDVRPTTSTRRKADVEKNSEMHRRGLIIRRRAG